MIFPEHNHILDIHFSPDSYGWAVGALGSILHRKDGRWLVEASNAGHKDLFGVWAMNEDTAWAVGEQGLILRRECQVWVPQESGTDILLRGI